MKSFYYGKTELEYLMLHDAILSDIIKLNGILKIFVYEDIFEGLISQVLAQQVHRKTHLTIFNRLKSTIYKISPENILQLGYEGLKSCGISTPKCQCILELSQKCLNKEIDINSFSSLTDDQIIDILTKIKGVGRWTAEMILIFSLERKNILSLSDYGIRKGIELIYGKPATKDFGKELYERYSPYSTIASFYIWEVANSK